MIVTDPDGDGMRLLLQTGILPPIFDCPPSAWGRSLPGLPQAERVVSAEAFPAELPGS